MENLKNENIKKQEQLLDDANKRFKSILNDQLNPKIKKFESLGFNINKESQMFKNEISKRKGKSLKYSKYKYGSLIMVDFGLNVGDELCGNHFAIVLTNEDSPYNSLLTILPLSSKNKPRRISLGELIPNNVLPKLNESVINFNNFINDKFSDCEIEYQKIVEIYNNNNQVKIENITEFLKLPKDNQIQLSKSLTENDAKELVKSGIALENTKRQIEQNIKKVQDTINLYSSKNTITYAIIDQIQTISKFKILKPINEYDPIGNILVDMATMETIENKIVSRFFSKSKKFIDKTKKEC